MPTLPEFNIVIASVAPLLPTKKCISAPVVPTPEVVFKLRSEVVAVPPIKRGEVSEVEKAPVVAPDSAPDIKRVVMPDNAPLDNVAAPSVKEPLVIAPEALMVVTPLSAPLDIVIPLMAPEMVSPDEPCINPVTFRGLLRLNLSLSLSH